MDGLVTHYVEEGCLSKTSHDDLCNAGNCVGSPALRVLVHVALPPRDQQGKGRCVPVCLLIIRYRTVKEKAEHERRMERKRAHDLYADESLSPERRA